MNLASATGAILRRVPLLALLALPGCNTLLIWEEAPGIHARRLIGARLDGPDVVVGVERNDGHRGLYRATAQEMTDFVVVLDDEGDLPRDATWEYPADRDGESIALPPFPSFRTLDGVEGKAGPVSLRVSPSEPYFSIVSILDEEPLRRHVILPADGETNWSHPGTWLLVAATPVTAAVDLVTLPFQLVFFFFLMPECC